MLALTGACQQTKAKSVDPSPLHSSATPSVIPLPATLTPPDPSEPSQANLRSGFINHKGEFVIPPKFQSAGSFEGELASVATEKGFAYIDKAGKFVTPPGVYFSGWSGNCGESRSDYEKALYGIKQEVKVLNASGSNTEEKQSRFGYIDAKGKIVIPLTVHFCANPFYEGMAQIGDITQQATPDEIQASEELKKQTGYGDVPGLRYGYIDTTGKMVIPPQFHAAESFHWGIAKVGMKSFEPDPSTPGQKKPVMRYGYINKQGQYLLEPREKSNSLDIKRDITSCDQAKQVIQNYQKMTGSQTMGTLIPFYERWCTLGEGLSVSQGENVNGLINQAGKEVVPLNFKWSELGMFSEGLLAIKRFDPKTETSAWGYINKQGRWAIKPQFSYAGEFRDGMAPVDLRILKPGAEDYSNLLVNRDGKLLFPNDPDGGYQRDFTVDSEEEISEGLARVRDRNENRCFINNQGEFVIPCKFKGASNFSEGLAAVTIEIKPKKRDRY
jgi:hypothetical protein